MTNPTDEKRPETTALEWMTQLWSKLPVAERQQFLEALRKEGVRIGETDVSFKALA